MKFSPEEYNEMATEAILELLAEEHAAVWLEIEAKIAERPHPALPQPPPPRPPRGIDPHHLTNARRKLVATDQILEVAAPTRGGRVVSVYTLPPRRKLRTVSTRAAGRKRLLQARYLGWATGSSHIPNLIGEGGERVVQASLRQGASEATGYYLVKPEGGNIRTLLGHAISGGPLDAAAYLTVLDPDGQPIVLTVLIEVKNIRPWIYRSTAELFQLLYKAVRLHEARPTNLFLPVLVCRRAHYTTFELAKELGFHIISIMDQPLLPHSTVATDAIEEVRTELGYQLLSSEDPHPFIVANFKTFIPRDGLQRARRWQQTAAALVSSIELLQQLRGSSLSQARRAAVLEQLRTAARKLPEVKRGWEPEDDFGDPEEVPVFDDPDDVPF